MVDILVCVLDLLNIFSPMSSSSNLSSSSPSIVSMAVKGECLESLPAKHQCTIRYSNGSEDGKYLTHSNLVSDVYWPFVTSQSTRIHLLCMVSKADPSISKLFLEWATAHHPEPKKKEAEAERKSKIKKIVFDGGGGKTVKSKRTDSKKNPYDHPSATDGGGGGDDDSEDAPTEEDKKEMDKAAKEAKTRLEAAERKKIGMKPSRGPDPSFLSGERKADLLQRVKDTLVVAWAEAARKGVKQLQCNIEVEDCNSTEREYVNSVFIEMMKGYQAEFGDLESLEYEEDTSAGPGDQKDDCDCECHTGGETCDCDC
jgi:hypothetical protein